MSYHLHGIFKQPDDFTSDKYWKPLKEFMYKLGSMSRTVWREVLSVASDATSDDEAAGEEQANLSVFSAYRAGFQPPQLSPRKEEPSDLYS